MPLYLLVALKMVTTIYGMTLAAVPKESPHWLYQWIDEFAVNTENLRTVFKSANAVSRLADLAASAIEQGAHPPADGTNAIVSGRTLDINSQYTCGVFGCMKARVERTFLSTWHYFDSIVVAGPSEAGLVRNIATTKKANREKFIIQPLQQDIELFLYLRDIGADKHVIFRQKDFNFHLDCYKKQADILGVSSVTNAEARARALNALKAEAHVHIWRMLPKLWAVQVAHASLPETLVFNIQTPRKPTTEEALLQFLDRGAFAHMEDVVQAQRMRLPLLQEVRSDFSSFENAKKATEDAVAVKLELPFLEGLPAAELIKFMADERSSFDRFQGALRKAVRERVEKAGEKSAGEISKQIDSEIVRPGLAEINVSLKAAKKVFGGKSGTAIGIGSALVTVGILTAMPLVIAAGVTAAASPMLDAKKFLDDRAALESKDMYFLWRMQKKAQKFH